MAGSGGWGQEAGRPESSSSNTEPSDGLVIRAIRAHEDVAANPDLFRPAEVNILLGDSSKARARLGWKSSIGFEELVREMVEEDCRALGAGSFVRATAPVK